MSQISPHPPQSRRPDRERLPAARRNPSGDLTPKAGLIGKYHCLGKPVTRQSYASRREQHTFASACREIQGLAKTLSRNSSRAGEPTRKRASSVQKRRIAHQARRMPGNILHHNKNISEVQCAAGTDVDHGRGDRLGRGPRIQFYHPSESEKSRNRSRLPSRTHFAAPRNAGRSLGRGNRRLTWAGIVERTGNDNPELARIDRGNFFGRALADGVVGLRFERASSVSRRSASGAA